MIVFVMMGCQMAIARMVSINFFVGFIDKILL